jgi:hypothetical protein
MIHFHKWNKWIVICTTSFGGTNAQERDCATCGKVVRRWV